MRGTRLTALAILLLCVGTSFSAPSRANRRPKQPTANRSGPDIHLLAVAVNRKKDGNVHAFDKYAREVRGSWAKHHTGRFQARSLLGENATRDNVLQEMQHLEKRSGPNTISVVYLDLHGGGSKNGLRMATAGSTPLLKADDLKRELPKFRGKVLLVLDTCHAGSFLTNKPLNLPNVAVITACGPKQLAYGKLPHVLAEAVSGKADYNHDGVVSIGEVARYVKASHKQPKVQPVVQIPSSMSSVPVAKR